MSDIVEWRDPRDFSNGFTMWFAGDLRDFPNPHKTNTPFGRAVTAGIGNAFEECDNAADEIERLRADNARMREALEMGLHCIPAMEGAKGYDKVAEVFLCRARAALAGKE